MHGNEASIRKAAQLLNGGSILAVKGLGGYHLACDARNAAAIAALRERKYRKEKPFALMARDLDVARELVELTRRGGGSTDFDRAAYCAGVGKSRGPTELRRRTTNWA